MLEPGKTKGSSVIKNVTLLLCLFTLLLTSCQPFAPGSQTRKNATANIQAFEDTNRNGKWDSGEPVFPNTLIAARSNIHGTMTYTAQLTDAAGETSISATYTHFFDLFAIHPRGYESTTPNPIDAKRKNEFGFAPVNPQAGIPDLYILLWQDENQDGEYQTSEMPLAGESLYIDPGLPWEYDDDISLGQLHVQTDSGGETSVNLGNTCGEVTIKIPSGWQLPNAEDKQHFTITYLPGRTNIFLGVVPDE